MNFFKLSEKRYSHRLGYLDKPVKRETLKKILKTATQAPSGKNSGCIEFVLIDDSLKSNKITKILKKPFLVNCPVYIACIVDKEPQKVFFGHHFQIEDCSAAVENMLLAITESKLASLWIDGYIRIENRAEQIAEIIALPDNKKIQILLPIGYPQKKGKQPKKKQFRERAFYNNYGSPLE